MDPNIWGPGAWTFLHSVTLNYPKRPTYLDKQRYSQFFNDIQYILPCPICKQHYKLNLKENPIQLDSRDNLVRWLVLIHNKVNQKNNKRMWSLDEFYEKYKKMYSDEFDYSALIPVLLIVIFIIIVIYFINQKKQPPF